MNAITITFSLLTLWSLLSFNRCGRTLKIKYGLLAYALVVLFGVQSICLMLLNCHASVLQMLLTIALSIPIIHCGGNVSETYREVTFILRRFIR